MQLKFLKNNPISKFFEKLALKNEDEVYDSSNDKNDRLKDQIEFQKINGVNNFVFTEIDFDRVFRSKKERVANYRAKANITEINEGLDYVCDDSIVPDENGNVTNLQLSEEIPAGVKSKIEVVYEKLIYDVLDFNRNGWDLYRNFLVDAELYLELLPNKKKNKIVSFKKLPPWKIVPIYNNKQIIKFAEKTGNSFDETPTYESNQIAYVNYGIFGKDVYDVRGYLEPVLRPLNQLTALEDCILVYKISRAPEKRVFSVDVGKMPPGRASEYLKNLIRKYRKKFSYNSSTGKVDSEQNKKSMLEDYWFAKTESGKGTDVNTIGGSMDMGDLKELDIFKEKVYKSMKLPKSRWQRAEESQYYRGKVGDVTREEIKFNNFINRTRNKFKYVVLNPLYTMMKLEGIEDKYINNKAVDIGFNTNNPFAENKKLDMLESKFRILSDASRYIVGADKYDKESIFSKEFVLKNYFNMDEEMYKENKKMFDKEADEIKKNMPESGGSRF